MIFRKHKTKNKDIFQEELVQSPGRTAARAFFKRKLSIIGMVVFLFIFISVFVLSYFLPTDFTHLDPTQLDIAPGFNFLSVPRALRSDAQEISLGSTFGAGVDSQGNLHMWGTMAGNLRNRRAFGERRTSPMRTVELGPVRLVAAGLEHIVTVEECGRVQAWGGTHIITTRIPETLWNPHRTNNPHIIDIRAAHWTTIALDDTGTLHFWGNDSFFNFHSRGLAGQITAFDINFSSAIGLTVDRYVYVMTTRDTQFSNIPDSIQGRAIDIALTDTAGGAVLDDGTVVTWTTNTTASEQMILDIPEHIQGRAVQIEGGRNHFTALLDDGSVAGWGYNHLNQTNTPRRLNGQETIETGYFQNVSIDADGNVTTWGHRGYLMGTDQGGRDIFRRVVHGGRITFTVGFVAVAVAAFIGVILGSIAGYYGKLPDMLIMRLAEVIESIPFLPLVIVLSIALGSHLSDTQVMVMIMVLLGCLTWPAFARLTRGQFLTEREREFVVAARAMGVRNGSIIFKHIMPNVMSIVLVAITMSLAASMLTEATLSFLGFGIRLPTPTWGNMLDTARDGYTIVNLWWRWAFPALFLGLSTISINLMGDGLRDALDPRVSGGGR
ncbi:MAG: ABC transporter permease subunit [Oscillospiraceae bacterium]|nr:ABC transporter permease subunit [Oscillospiraceae bacterium]